MRVRSITHSTLGSLRELATRLILTRPFAGTPKTDWSANQTETGYAVKATTEGTTFSLSWTVPRPYDVEVHGHSFALLDRKKAHVGEVRIEADGPAKLVRDRAEKQSFGVLGQQQKVTLTACADVRLHVHTNDGLLVPRGVSGADEAWSVWQGERHLTYLLEEPISEAGCSKLCVAFSAIGAPYDFTYNYRSSLKNEDAYRLYILDNFGSQGSYYFSDHRDQTIFNAVQDFITEKARQLGVNRMDISMLGTSKGGTAAIAHGLKLGAGRVVAGAPQYLPGSYLKAAAPGILSFIAGADDEESVAWLDGLIPNSLTELSRDTAVTILVGENDSHLKFHVRPFMEFAERENLDATVLVVEDLSHQDIGRAFSPYVGEVLRAGDDRARRGSLVPYQFEWRNGVPGNEVQLKTWVPPGEVISAVFKTENGALQQMPSHSSTYFRTAVPVGQKVWATVTRRAADGVVGVLTFDTKTLEPRRN
ncbi:hypothetical protein GCM10009636_31830 [Arthrobacter koreensis]